MERRNIIVISSIFVLLSLIPLFGIQRCSSDKTIDIANDYKVDEKEKLVRDAKRLLALRQYKGKYIRLLPIFDDEIVEGKKGEYYECIIGEPEQGGKTFYKDITFKAGRYILNDHDKSVFHEAIQAIQDTILTGIIENAGKDYEIYIQGSADSLGHNNFRRSKKPLPDEGAFPYSYPQGGIFQIHPHVTTQQSYIFSINTVPKKIFPDTLRNEDLPNCRAYFIQQAVLSLKNIKKDKVHLLDGSVSTRISATDRKVRITLFVPYLLKDTN